MVYAWVRRVPAGRVVTYGQVAEALGHPHHARQVGQALAALADESGASDEGGAAVPWHRVVNASGGVSQRMGPIPSERTQRQRLEAEGVAFSAAGRVSLTRYRWDG